MVIRINWMRGLCCWGVGMLCVDAKPAALDVKSRSSSVLPLQGRVWADEHLLGSPVALSLDTQGRAYVVQTLRRKESELDIRSHPDWVVPTLSFESVADRQRFYEQELSAERSPQNRSWLKDRNGDGVSDFRDLGVLSEKVLLIEDRGGTGRANHAAVFADGMNHPMTGVAAGVMVWDDHVYVTAIPHLLKMPTNRRETAIDVNKDVLLSGFGVHVAYSGHDMHGLTRGLDGRVYWSIGDKGVNVKLATGEVVKNAHSGAVLRCEPDGSHLELYATGLRNPQEIAFDAWGNLFTVDNDGDFKGERERLVYIAERSDSGWRCNWQYRQGQYNPWMDEKLCFPAFSGQAAFITPPLAFYSDGPSGLVFNPGTALGKSLQEMFFVTQFPGRKLSGFRLEPQGASFRLAHEQLVYRGPMMTGLSWGPDGCLYVADWNSSAWDPHDRGQIWQLDVTPTEKDPRRAETARLLSRGAAVCSLTELEQSLAHADQRVRLAAQLELVKRRQSALLLKVATQGQDLLARVHALWGLGQLGRAEAASLVPILPLLSDPQPEVRAQVCKVVGDVKLPAAVPSLVRCLNDASPRVQYHAAIALAKQGDAACGPALVQAVAQQRDGDVFLRHALITAMAGCAMELLPLQSHPEVAVRVAAVVALRRRGDAAVQHFLQDSSPLVVREAARAIHDDDSMPTAMPALAQWLALAKGDDPIVTRRAISANWRCGDAAGLERLAQFAARRSVDLSMREEALATLAMAVTGSALDRVEGRYRNIAPVAAERVTAAVSAHVSPLLKDPEATIRVLACQLVAATRWSAGAPLLLEVMLRSKEPVNVQAAAYAGLVALRARELQQATPLALVSAEPELREAALQQLASGEHATESVLPALKKILHQGSVAEQQRALALLAKLKGNEVTALLREWWQRLLAGQVPASLRLDVIEAVRSHDDVALRADLEREEQKRQQAGVAAVFQDALEGGDAARGKKIALEHLAAQCTRCHRLGGEGAEVGPDLSKVAQRLTREQLWQSMIEPSAVIAPGYGMMTLQRRDGSTLSGTLLRESATHFTVRGSDGVERELKKSDVASSAQAPSVMPPMGLMLKPAELRDVVEYLTTLK